MNYSIIRYVTGWVIALEAAFMVFPALISLVFAEYTDALIFVACSAFCALGGFLMARKKPKNTAFFAREGFVMVALSWLVLALIGSVPFWVSGTIPSFVDALFETVSGFTTTGATILVDVESLPHGMIFWRSFTHWIGGMGVLVFMLAVLPMAGGHSMYLMKAESTGPSVSKLMPNLRKTALVLYAIYFAMTLAQFLLLITVGQMPVFDAICIAVGSAGTGGFGVKNDSMAGYTIAAQIITGVFIVLFGINFSVYFLLLTKRFKNAFSISEMWCYLGIYVGVSVLIVANVLWVNGGDFWMTVHEVFFNSASVMTTTGFATMDYDAAWPTLAKGLMLLLMCIGGCAGSTAGGLKVARLMMYGKSTAARFSHMLHPRSVKVLKMDGKAIERDTLSNLHTYLFCYIAILFVSFLLISLDGKDLITSFTSVIATFNNIGPGFGEVGPVGNFSDFSIFSKLVFIFNMLAGRLEIFPLLLMFIPATWKK